MSKTTAIQRFADRVRVVGGGCWEWTGAKTSDGYGLLTDDSGKREYAHRFSYSRFVGEIPEGLEIDHVCRRRSCVNPDPQHLEAVTRLVNVTRGLRGAGKQRKSVCKAGHPIGLGQSCKPCKQKYDRDRYQRRKCGRV